MNIIKDVLAFLALCAILSGLVFLAYGNQFEGMTL